MYCTDADLFRWEPRLADEAADVSQTPGDARGGAPTFGAQRRVVSDLLARLARPGARADDLRRAAALGTLHLIYAALAAASAPGAEADATVRRELYERLYRRALRAVVAAFAGDDDDAPPRGRPRLFEFVVD